MKFFKAGILAILFVAATSVYAMPCGPVPLPPSNQMAAMPCGPVPLPPDAMPCGPVPLPPDAV